MIEHRRRSPEQLAALRILALLLLALASACVTSRDAVANLGELYTRRDESVADYAALVTDRGFFARLGRTFGTNDDPAALYESEELEDPIAFALDNLARLELSDADDLDPCERVAAIATLAEMARLDRARIVRARAIEVLQSQLAQLDGPRKPAAVAAIDDAELNRKLDPLLRLAEAEPAAIAAVLANESAALMAASAELASVQPDAFLLALRLTRLAAKSTRRAIDGGGAAPLCSALDRAGFAAARHLAFLVARADRALGRGVLDGASEVRLASGALLLSIDPIAATVEFGRAWTAAVAPTVRVAWLQQLELAPIVAANVHPTLRAVLVQELQSDDAAVAYAARHAVCHLLARDPQGAKLPELKAAWLALGEWQSTPTAGESR